MDNFILEKIFKYGIVVKASMVADGMYALICDITPEVAERMLTTNIGNRNVRNNRVELYASDMEHDLWDANGVPIIFNSDGILKDGQHRLKAVVKSGCTLKTQIVVFSPNKEANSYDIGATRSARDIAHFEGYSDAVYNSNIVYAVVNYSGVLSTGGRAVKGKGVTYSKKEVVEKIAIYYDACEYILNGYKAVPTKLKKASVWAAIFNAYNAGYPMEKLDKFCKILTTGIMEEKHDVTVIRFRDYFLTSASASCTSDYIQDTYMRTQQALYNYDKEKAVSRCCTTLTEYYKPVKKE